MQESALASKLGNVDLVMNVWSATFSQMMLNTADSKTVAWNSLLCQ
jgi:hypothetical protein